MAALWQLSRTKEYDVNGDPIIGAKAHFYNVGTTTPQTVYVDSDLSIAHDQPVLTDGYGRWPQVFFNPSPGEFRHRVLSSDDVLIFDDDGVSVPLEASYTPPDAGETSVTLLFQTGDIKPRYGTGTLTGYVRCNGRTMGSATSGATERANSDCQALFLHLWGADANLTVSGGRGANAAADWAANKTIALPDFRDRALIGLGDMGATDANRIADTLVDGSGTNTTLGATVGASTVTLTTDQLPAHNHTASFSGNALPTHSHTMDTRDDANGGDGPRISNTDTLGGQRTISTAGTSAGTPSGSVTVNNNGGGAAHPNIQPSVFVTIYMKL